MKPTNQISPGPSSVTAFGNLMRFRAAPMEFMKEMKSAYGDLVRLRLGPKLFYFAFHPDHARRVLNERGPNYPKSTLVFREITPITGVTGLVQLDGEKWAKYRRITNQIFQPTSLQQYVPAILDCADELCADWKQISGAGQEVDAVQGMTDLVLTTAGKMFFGVDIGREAPQLGRAFLAANRICGERLRSIINVPRFIPTRSNRGLSKSKKELEVFFENLLLEETDSNQKNLISVLKEDASPAVSLSDQLSTFLFAGHETTATSLAWTLLLVSENPDVQRRVRAEAGELFDSDLPVSSPEFLAKIESCAFIRSVYQESLRLYPPAWILAREVREDDELCGRKIEGGANLLLSIHEIHRHEAFWERAEEFEPDRFIRRQDKRHPYSYIPFGAGPRICSGMRLAMMEAVIILARLCARFSFRRKDLERIAVDPMITSHPRGGISLWVNENDEQGCVAVDA